MIGVLIFPDFQLLDAAGPIAAFEIAARLSRAFPASRRSRGSPGRGQFFRRRDAGPQASGRRLISRR